LVLLESSDDAIPSGAGSFFFKKRRFCVELFIFWALALVVFARYESWLRAHPGLICSPGQGTTKDWVKILLQRNNKYSFTQCTTGAHFEILVTLHRERSGLYEFRKGHGLGYQCTSGAHF
jgi:hypothetical protein